LPGPSNYGENHDGNGGTVIVEVPQGQNEMKMPAHIAVREMHCSGFADVLIEQKNIRSSSWFDKSKNNYAAHKRQEQAGKVRQTVPEVPFIVIREDTTVPPTTPRPV